MKAVTGYAVVMCVSLILVAVAMKGMVPTQVQAKKSTIQASIEARKAALEGI
jgi:transposase